MKITSLPIHFLAVISFLLCGTLLNAQEHSVAEANDEGPVNTQQEITDYTNHHNIKNVHYRYCHSSNSCCVSKTTTPCSIKISLFAR